MAPHRDMRFSLIALAAVFCILVANVLSVDRNNFRTCDQTSFCRRCRAVQPGASPYQLNLDSLQTTASSVSAEILNSVLNVKFVFQLYSLADNTFRMKINELSPLKPRHEVNFVLNGEPNYVRLEVLEKTSEKAVVKSGENKVEIFANPFRVDVYRGTELLISTNARGLMRFEHLRPKPAPKPETPEGEEQAAVAPTDDTESDPGAWEENYKSHHDSKPNGPSAVAMDFTFPGAEQAYGVPLHADFFALRNTKGIDPYRLFNLDVFEYELENGMSLYGAIPVLYAHGLKESAGVFWLNTAETWIDIAKPDGENVVSSIVNLVSGSGQEPQVDAHFMSESGIVDVFFFLGPKPLDVFRQYSALTGSAPLPPLFSLGYHQCRWNYNDEDDVRNVALGFDEHDIPMDVMWLDIEHTDGKKYFTWDPVKFAHPTDMINNLTAMGRKLVTIVDPHIKRDGGYFLHQDAEANGYYVKNKDGNDYEGWCWPGSVSYLDLFNPVVREYYASRYLLSNYVGSTLDLHIWNDMNEPSVFNGPEVTMLKDNIHYGGWEHRDVHNQYGFMQHMSTYEGMVKRSQGTLRPFILTRSFFAGSQRYSAMWTGDNLADWGHMRMSVPMCLTMAVSGYSFCGADVGGFFKYPDAELFARWYQLGAFLPFFRAHSIIESKRREPWLYNPDTTAVVRQAIRRRYNYLSLWYTLFYEHSRYSTPVILPLYALYPKDKDVYAIDNEFLVGDALLVHPVVTSQASEVQVVFPGENERWYETETFELFRGRSTVSVPVDMNKIPVYQRGGTIVSRLERVRRSTALMHNDPYTLVVALDDKGFAKGTLYIDDGETFKYKSNEYLYIQFEFSNKSLKAKFIDKKAHFPSKAWIERVVILGLNKKLSSDPIVKSKSVGEQSLKFSSDDSYNVVVVRKPGVSVTEEWTLSFSF